MIITEIHTQDHPLIRNYSTSDDKFDLTKIYKNNLHYERSSDSKGIQIADMAASIISHAVCGLVTFDNLINYGLLLNNNLWDAEHCHALFCVTDRSQIDYSCYQGLTEAVAKVRGGDEWRSILRQRLSV